MHGETGPCLSYRDGWTHYAWHGTQVPAEWFTKRKSLTATKALTWRNIEQRRAACEILGWNNILKQLDAEVIDENKDPQIGTLLEVEVPGFGERRFLKVQCGTGREFAIPVPNEMNSALQANAWTYGFDDPRQFKKPEVRT